MQCVLGSDAEGYDQVLFHLYKNGSALLVFLVLIVIWLYTNELFILCSSFALEYEECCLYVTLSDSFMEF